MSLLLFHRLPITQEPRARTTALSAILTYGIIDPVDIILNIPYQVWRTENSGSMTKDDGIADMAVEAKWRFYENKVLSVALKPGFTIPTGNEEKGSAPGV